MRDYQLFILPTDEAPWLTVPESAVSMVPGGRPETLDIPYEGPMGYVLLRFRPKAPGSYVCYLIAMMTDYTDGYLNRYSRSL